MKIFNIIIFFIFTYSTLLGRDVPEPDKIIYNGKEYSVFIYPMEGYFDQYPEKRPTITFNLSRGYVATSEIRDSQLYLKDIEIQIATKDEKSGDYNNNWKSVRNEIFPNQNLIKIDWTGFYILSSVGTENFDYISYDYSDYTLIEIENGNLTKEKRLLYTEYIELMTKKSQDLNRKTAEYEKTQLPLLERKKQIQSVETDIFVGYKTFAIVSCILVIYVLYSIVRYISKRLV